MTEAPPAWTQQAPPSSATAAQTAEEHEAELFRPYSTLDEPVTETIMRDVRAVMAKLKVVLLPMDRRIPILQSYDAVASHDASGTAPEGSNSTPNDRDELSENDKKVLDELRNWDLGGPLLLCLALAVLLTFKAPRDQGPLVFSTVVCAVWIGGSIITLQTQLLGGTLSFFQGLCVIGYCIFPLVLAAAVIWVVGMAISWMWIHLIIIAVGFVWSTRASSVFLSLYVKPERRFLALYPLFFFYTFLGWMILLF